MAFDKEEIRRDRVNVDLRTKGTSGLRRWGGIIAEDELPRLTGRRAIEIYREMVDNDATCGTIQFLIDQLCRGVTWRVEAVSDSQGDLEAREFVQGCMSDMSNTWTDFISEVMSMLTYGYSVHEIVYKRRAGISKDERYNSRFSDGRVGWHGFPMRSQETVSRWLYSDSGILEGYVQIAPPKYQPVTIDMYRTLLFRTDAKKNSPVGQSIFRRAYRCFSSDTEVLTDKGWIVITEANKKTSIATLDPKGRVEYQRPTRVWSYPHTGQMIEAKSRFVDQLVTPNHRMWVRREHRDDFEFIEAQDCPISASFSCMGEWSKKERKSIKIGTKTIPFDLWCSFMGHWLAEGHVAGRKGAGYEVGVTQKDGPKADAIVAVLEALPWTFKKGKERGDKGGVYTYRNHSMELWQHLQVLGKQPVRTAPRYLLDACPRQIHIWLMAYLDGDGTRGSGCTTYKDSVYTGTDLISTSSPVMADNLMEAALKCGYRATKRLQREPRVEGHHCIWAVTLGKVFPKTTANWSHVDYDGKVHCVTVPNGIVMTRRNGKASWSGNSWYLKRGIENIEGIGIERDLAGLPMARVPEECLMEGATDGQRANAEMMMKIVTNIRRDEQEGIVMPSAYDEKGNQLYDLKLLTSGGSRNFDTDKIIQRYDHRIAMTVLGDFILLGQGASGSGSWAMHTDKTQLFAKVITAFLDVVAQTLNRVAIPRLLAVNDFVISDYPKFVHEGIDSPDLGQIGTFLTAMTQAGAQPFPNKDLENTLLRMAGLPASEAEVAGPPEGTVTTGITPNTQVTQVPEDIEDLP